MIVSGKRNNYLMSYQYIVKNIQECLGQKL